MATNLLVSPLLAHCYHHNLESFFYILIWAVIYYNLNNKTQGCPSQLLALWGDQSQALASKLSMWGPGNAGVASKNAIFELVHPEFQGILQQWISPLFDLFDTAFQSVLHRLDHPEFSMYDHATCNGLITFETFMAAIGVKLRSVEAT